MRALLYSLLLLLPAITQAQSITLSGNLSSVGSDTLGYLMTLWGEDFSRQAPGVNVQVQASGSSTAPTALAAGAAQLGAMSRPMQVDERQAFEAHYGYPPLAVPVAMDALVVVVNQRNPLQQIEPRQLDAIFSITRLCGATATPARWGDLGLQQADWIKRNLQRYGRNSASGTWGSLNSRRCAMAISVATWQSFPVQLRWCKPLQATREALAMPASAFISAV